MKRPAFQMYAGDWISSASIALMTPAEEGGYVRLLCYEWLEDDCGLPDNDEQLAVLSRLGESWKTSRVRKQFVQRNGRLYNEKLLAVRAASDTWLQQQRDSGKKGAEKRWGTDGEPMATPFLKNGKPIARARDSSSSSSSTSTETSKVKIFSPPLRDGGDSYPRNADGSYVCRPEDGGLNVRQRVSWDKCWPLYWNKLSLVSAKKAFAELMNTEEDFERVETAVTRLSPEMWARRKATGKRGPTFYKFLHDGCRLRQQGKEA